MTDDKKGSAVKPVIAPLMEAAYTAKALADSAKAIADTKAQAEREHFEKLYPQRPPQLKL
jgi:hypothetical protein